MKSLKTTIKAALLMGFVFGCIAALFHAPLWVCVVLIVVGFSIDPKNPPF